MTGEDPRLITIGTDQTLWVAFCQRYRRANPELWMSYAQVFLTNHSLTLGTTVNFNYKLESPKEQKNWSPFEVDDPLVPQQKKLLFIQSIDPHRIVHSVKTSMPQHVFGETLHLSHSPAGNLSHLWRWGELRGGTPALLLAPPFDPHYLSFFHSSNMPPRTGDVLQTYAMGAYTFCPTPPYKILKMSSRPIIHDSMYTGNWTNLPLSFYHIDYVVFPMSYFIEGNALFLTYGKQDQEGWVVRLDLKRLLDSLSTVEASC
jgi:hypothetical protein